MENKIIKYATGFAQISNIVLMDNNLSLKAKGLYAYLFSKPDGWIFYRDKILAENKDSRDGVRAGINELIEHGYIKRYQLNQNGKFGGMIYEFIDPNIVLSTKTPWTENPYTEKPAPENTSTNNIYNINTKDILNNKYINTTIKEKINKKEKDEKTTYQQGLSTKLSTINNEKIIIKDGFRIDTSDQIFNNLEKLGKEVIEKTEHYFLINEKYNTVSKLAIIRKALEISKRG